MALNNYPLARRAHEHAMLFLCDISMATQITISKEIFKVAEFEYRTHFGLVELTTRIHSDGSYYQAIHLPSDTPIRLISDDNLCKLSSAQLKLPEERRRREVEIVDSLIFLGIIGSTVGKKKKPAEQNTITVRKDGETFVYDYSGLKSDKMEHEALSLNYSNINRINNEET